MDRGTKLSVLFLAASIAVLSGVLYLEYPQYHKGIPPFRIEDAYQGHLLRLSDSRGRTVWQKEAPQGWMRKIFVTKDGSRTILLYNLGVQGIDPEDPREPPTNYPWESIAWLAFLDERGKRIKTYREDDLMGPAESVMIEPDSFKESADGKTVSFVRNRDNFFGATVTEVFDLRTGNQLSPNHARDGKEYGRPTSGH